VHGGFGQCQDGEEVGGEGGEGEVFGPWLFPCAFSGVGGGGGEAVAARVEGEDPRRGQALSNLRAEDGKGEARRACAVVGDEERAGGFARTGGRSGRGEVGVVGDGAVGGREEELALEVGGPGDGIKRAAGEAGGCQLMLLLCYDGVVYPCGRANRALPGDGITVPVDDMDEADDESSSCGVLGTEPEP